jgi:hypothetical protein
MIQCTAVLQPMSCVAIFVCCKPLTCHRVVGVAIASPSLLGPRAQQGQMRVRRQQAAARWVAALVRARPEAHGESELKYRVGSRSCVLAWGLQFRDSDR